jgi:hypothetical protein
MFVALLLVVSAPGVDPEPPPLMKVLAAADWHQMNYAPPIEDGKHLVLRSASELARAIPDRLRRGIRDLVEKDVADEAARLLKIRRIDWKKQMLLVVGGQWRRPYVVEIVAITRKGATLTVSWKLVETDGGEDKTFWAATMAVVPAPQGKVVFERVK